MALEKEGLPQYTNNPTDVVRRHLDQVQGAGVRPNPTAVADTIREFYSGYEGTKDVLGTGIELAIGINHATFGLASLFNTDDAVIPKRWKDPEATRAVLSACGEVELGILKGRRIHRAREGGWEKFTPQINTLQSFIDDLQARS